jgi:hypothetical protein
LPPFTLILLALCFWTGFASKATAQRATEYDVKAAFLFNFARFVTWPDSAFANADERLVIGVIGKDPFGPILRETIQDKMAQNRSLTVRNVESSKDIRGCHILFVGAATREEVSKIVSQVGENPVLTVSEQNHFCQLGGMVNFLLVSRRVRFEINPHAVERSGLSVSSRLLKLARIVEDP